MKVTCNHDDEGYHGDMTTEEIKHTAMGLICPNFHSIESGVQLVKVEAEFHNDDNLSIDDFNFRGCPDIVYG